MNITAASFKDRMSRTRVALPDGTEADVRALTVGQENAIRAAFPEPRPPLVKNPNGGSLSTTPNLQDPDYVRAWDAWYERVCIVRLAIGLGYRPSGHTTFDRTPADQQAAWMNIAHAELVDAAEVAWMRDAIKAQSGLTLAAALKEAGQGNSGSSVESPKSSAPRSKKPSTDAATPSGASQPDASSS